MSEWDDDQDDDADESPGRSRRPIVIGVIALLVLALGAVIAYRVGTRKDSGTANGSTASSTAPAVTSTAGGASTTRVAVEAPPTSTAVTGPAASTTATAAPSTAAAATTAAAAETVAPTTAAAATVPDTAAASTTAAAPSSTEAPAAVPAPATPAPVTYATLPDGTPAPIIAVFGADKITISGNVPDQAAKDSLQGLAIANARTPVPVTNLLTIDPTVPRSIGVRVVELTSARFDEGSAKIVGQHAKELDRITAIMNSVPKVTVLIIGHADQIGSTTANYALSAQRAAAVVAYLVQSGIDPARLSSKAVGDTDLLTLNSDEASLALNRRTEFIIYGLLGP